MKHDDNDTNLYYDELTANSFTSELFKYGWQNKMEYYEKSYERYRIFDNAITQLLEDRGFITYDEYMACCSYLNHTSLEPDEILITVFRRQS
jgi:hypothetical protein